MCFCSSDLSSSPFSNSLRSGLQTFKVSIWKSWSTCMESLAFPLGYMLRSCELEFPPSDSIFGNVLNVTASATSSFSLLSSVLSPVLSKAISSYSSYDVSWSLSNAVSPMPRIQQSCQYIRRQVDWFLNSSGLILCVRFEDWSTTHPCAVRASRTDSGCSVSGHASGQHLCEDRKSLITMRVMLTDDIIMRRRTRTGQ